MPKGKWECLESFLNIIQIHDDKFEEYIKQKIENKINSYSNFIYENEHKFKNKF